MIKLNNNKITYVALADTNNSIKAPKEIWYADSNNSVKLVYRRKDALIEGEDYEKYHWLKKDDGSAYIDTLINPSFEDELSIIFTLSSKPTVTNIHLLFANDNVNYVGFFTGGNFFNRGNPQILVVTNQGGTQGYIACDEKVLGTTIKEYYMYMKINNAQMPDTTVKADGVICNPTSIVGDNRISEVPIATYKVGKGYSLITGLDTAKLKNITISSKINLIPCKLLKPVPKWLDANGIRRQVGECGMIDLVSGKFYGNVNSVGTFTVENYYERKEWLVGDGNADFNAYFSYNVIQYSIGAINSYAVLNACSFNGGGAFQFVMNDWHNPSSTKNVGIYDNQRSNWYNVPMQNVNTIKIDSTSNSNNIVVNDVDISNPNKIPSNVISIIDIVNANGIKVSAITINAKTRLIPCTLTMDLPASMDANNIARTKGTSGMWDLVSDRFYGNVANSGTFKAVNLAEGVDYEVHDWLVGDGSAYIQGIDFNLWDNNLSLQIGKVSGGIAWRYFIASFFNITEGRDVGSSYSYLMVIFRQNNDSLPHIADIRHSSMPDVVSMDFYIENSLFYCNQNGVVKTNNPAQTAIESTWKSVAPKIYSAKMSYIREVLPDNSYRSNLIPVKLLKSIPSKYDANGIARNAGECGMYDTVNDVFYGNVASSGTFSVSDDS